MKKNSKINYKKGISLVELIVTTGLVSVLALVVSVLLVRSLTTYRITNKSINMQEDAAKVMREFEYSSRAASEIVTATVSEFTYLRYFDLTSTSPTQIRFYEDNGQFKMGRTEPFGTPPTITYPQGDEVVTLLIDDVVAPTSTIFFNYFDDFSVQIPSLLDNPPVPVNIPAVKMVEFTITVDDDINTLPQSVTEITRVHLRNMKTNL